MLILGSCCSLYPGFLVRKVISKCSPPTPPPKGSSSFRFGCSYSFICRKNLTQDSAVGNKAEYRLLSPWVLLFLYLTILLWMEKFVYKVFPNAFLASLIFFFPPCIFAFSLLKFQVLWHLPPRSPPLLLLLRLMARSVLIPNLSLHAKFGDSTLNKTILIWGIVLD